MRCRNSGTRLGASYKESTFDGNYTEASALEADNRTLNRQATWRQLPSRDATLQGELEGWWPDCSNWYIQPADLVSMRFASNMFAGLLLALTISAANASLMDIRFTAAGAATGFGVLTRDSALLAANFSTTSTAVPVGFESLDLARDVGNANTFFHLTGLTRAYLVVSSTKTITDLNFRALLVNGTVQVFPRRPRPWYVSSMRQLLPTRP